MKRLIFTCLGVLLVGLMLGGCSRPLFPENLPRTQYERFDRVRGTYAPSERQGQYGDPVPALRDRLTPYE